MLNCVLAGPCWLDLANGRRGARCERPVRPRSFHSGMHTARPPAKAQADTIESALPADAAARWMNPADFEADEKKAKTVAAAEAAAALVSRAP